MKKLNIIFKTIFLWEKRYLFYMFLWIFFSLFIYVFSKNVVNSVNDYLDERATTLLLWDFVIDTDSNKLSSSYFSWYEDYVNIAEKTSVDSTIFKDKQPQLVTVNYISDNFPFYQDFNKQIVNPNWSLIVSKAIYERFWDNIEIFDKKYNVYAYYKEDVVSGFWFSENIYLPIQERPFEDKKVRLENNYYFKYKDGVENKEEILSSFKNKYSKYDFETIENSNESVSNIYDRLNFYITFFNLIVFILSFFIIILSMEAFFKKAKKTIWLLNTLWTRKNVIFIYIFTIIFAIFLLAYILAISISSIFIIILQSFFEFFTIYNSIFVSSIIINLIILLIWFSLPFYKIYKLNSLQLQKDSWDFQSFRKFDYIVYTLLIFLGFFLISLISNISILYSFIYASSFAIFILLSYMLISFLLKFIFSKTNIKNFYIFDAIRSTIKPWNMSFLIIFSSFISIISIFVFFVFSWSFMNYLNSLTKTSNDSFIINIQSDDLTHIEDTFEKQNIYEIVIMKIKSINWTKLNKRNDSWRFTREFYSTTKNMDEHIIKWEKLKTNTVSVDREFAESLWVDIWDKITFSIAWLEKTLEVINLRKAVRNWTNPFFFFNVYDKDFKKFPKQYMVSYKSSNFEENLEYNLKDKIWSHISFINVWNILNIILDIIKQVFTIIYALLIYIFILSILVFIVSLSFLSKFKESKIKILYTLWWNIKKLKNAIFIEYLYLLFLSIVLSIIIWTIILLAVFFFINYFWLSFYYYLLWLIFILSLSVFYFIYIYFYTKLFKV